jgi:acyl-[acyl carrier protein]--UDP-N-acetylglucosamine O-acyltransferase
VKKHKKVQEAYAEKGFAALYQEYTAVLAGASLGPASSVVSKDLPPYAVAAGNPPKVARMKTVAT